MEYIIAIVGGYLLGSIPFGLILTRLGGYGDIRDIGSGNIGATNVLRTGNKGLALATLILDAGKGALTVGLCYLFLGNPYFLEHCPVGIAQDLGTGDLTSVSCVSNTMDPVFLVAAFFAIIGHLFPVWLKFKGGKGVATTFGTLIALQPIVGIAACGVWLLTALVSRYSSLSALLAVASTPFFAHFLFADPNFTGMCGILASLIWFKHRANVQRLVKGEEPKIGQKK